MSALFYNCALLMACVLRERERWREGGMLLFETGTAITEAKSSVT